MVLMYLRWWYLSSNGGGELALCNKLKHKIKGFLDQNQEQEQVVLSNRVTQKNTFFVYNFGGPVTGAYG